MRYNPHLPAHVNIARMHEIARDRQARQAERDRLAIEREEARYAATLARLRAKLDPAD